MHGLILAGGEGARLAAGGIVVPKPLVEVAGKPQLLRLLETLDALGCDSLTCAIRADLAAVAPLLDGRRFPQAFVAGGARVATVEVARIIDIDRPSDLQVANAWLTAADASEPAV